ncbi:MAG: hypothetical protein ABIV36_18185 [Sphingobium limneticum]
MGLGKITRGLGKVGLAFEALGYVVAGGKALVRAVKGAPDAYHANVRPRQEQATDNSPPVESQG